MGSHHADAVWHAVSRCSATTNWTLMQIGSVKERSPILLATFARQMPHRYNRMYMSPSNSPHMNVVGESNRPMTLYGGWRPPLYRQRVFLDILVCLDCIHVECHYGSLHYLVRGDHPRSLDTSMPCPPQTYKTTDELIIVGQA